MGSQSHNAAPGVLPHAMRASPTSQTEPIGNIYAHLSNPVPLPQASYSPSPHGRKCTSYFPRGSSETGCLYWAVTLGERLSTSSICHWLLDLPARPGSHYLQRLSSELLTSPLLTLTPSSLMYLLQDLDPCYLPQAGSPNLFINPFKSCGTPGLPGWIRDLWNISIPGSVSCSQSAI